MGEWEQKTYEAILLLGDISQYKLTTIEKVIVEAVKNEFLLMCEDPYYFDSFNTQRIVKTEISRSNSAMELITALNKTKAVSCDFNGHNEFRVGLEK